MGGKSGGGGFSAGPSIQYGNRALALQEKMYDEAVERTQPYYEAGTAGLDVLMDMLGIRGGSLKSEAQWREELAPQYTSQRSVSHSPSGNSFLGVDLDSLIEGEGWRESAKWADADEEDVYNHARDYVKDIHYRSYQPESHMADAYQALLSQYSPKGYTKTQDVIDEDALSAAIAEKMASQGTPDGYGSLLEKFDLNKFRADPGYQFRLDEGKKAIERAASARGQYYDPSTVKALSEYNAGMADQTYNDSYNRYNMDQSNIFNRLAAITGIGQTAAGQMNSSGANNAQAAGNIFGQMGGAAQAAQNANASQPSMFNTLLGVGLGIGGMSSGSIFGKVLGF